MFMKTSANLIKTYLYFYDMDRREILVFDIFYLFLFFLVTVIIHQTTTHYITHYSWLWSCSSFVSCEETWHTFCNNILIKYNVDITTCCYSMKFWAGGGGGGGVGVWRLLFIKTAHFTHISSKQNKTRNMRSSS